MKPDRLTENRIWTFIFFQNFRNLLTRKFFDTKK